MPPRTEKRRCCGWRGKTAFKDNQLHAPCAAATGGDCHLMTRCRKCLGGNPLFVCLLCWGKVGSAVNAYISKRARKARPVKDPILDALRTTDFLGLYQSAIEAHQHGTDPVRGSVARGSAVALGRRLG